MKVTLLDVWYLNKHIKGSDPEIYSKLPKYANGLIDLCKTNPSLLFQCDVFEADIAKRVFKNDLQQPYNQLLDAGLLEYCELYNECQNAPIPTSTLLDKLCVYAVRYLNYDEQFMQNSLEKLFAQTLKIPEYMRSEQVYNFIIKYITKKECSRLNIAEIPCVTSDYSYHKQLANSTVEGTYVYSLDMITMSKKLLNAKENKSTRGKKLVDILHVLFHELNHAKQWSDLDNGTTSLETFHYMRRSLFDHYLYKKHSESEYRSNYKYEETEIGAELAGWSRTYKFLGEMDLLTSEDKYSILARIGEMRFRSLIRVKKTEKGDLLPGYIYNVQNLNNIAFHHTEEIRNNPLLQLFYYSNGLNRNFPDLLIAEKRYFKYNSDSSLKSIFADYYRFILSDDFDIRSIFGLPITAQRQVIAKIFDILIMDLQNLRDSMVLFCPHNSKEEAALEMVMASRVNEIVKIYSTLDYYYSMTKNNDKMVKGVLCTYAPKLRVVRRQMRDLKRALSAGFSMNYAFLTDDIKKVLKLKMSLDD